MAIQVTCVKCFSRFQVSEKFAGQKGPCPKCKTVITIPALSEQVVVHEAATGPKDASGRPILKPIFRKDAPITATHWTLAACSAFVMLTVALVARAMYFGKGVPLEEFPMWATSVGALLNAVPTALVGYILLRNPESPGFGGQELWIRVLACSLGFATLWVFSPLAVYTFNESLAKPSMLSQSMALAALIFGGGAISLLAFDFDYLYGIVHAATYVVLCAIMRLIAALPAIPGMNSGGETPDISPEVFGALEKLGVQNLFAQAGEALFLTLFAMTGWIG